MTKKKSKKIYFVDLNIEYKCKNRMKKILKNVHILFYFLFKNIPDLHIRIDFSPGNGIFVFSLKLFFYDLSLKKC